MPTVITHNDDARYITYDKFERLHNELEKVYDQYTIELSNSWRDKKDEIAAILSEDSIIAIDDYIMDGFLATPVLRRIGQVLLGHLIDTPIEVYNEFIHSFDAVPEEITLPDSLAKIAMLYCPERGYRTGKGEFVVPLLFRSGRWNSSESIYDVSIGDDDWHVKCVPTISKPIQMGKTGYSNTELARSLGAFMLSSELSAGKSKASGFIHNLDDIRAALKLGPATDPERVIELFQAQLDSDMRKHSVLDARGVIFFVEPNVIKFVDAEACFCAGATQGNHLVTTRDDFFITNYRLHMKRLRKAIFNDVAARFKKNMSLRYAKSRQRKANKEPSFSHVANIFAQRHGLDKDDFIKFCLDESSFQKTFARWNERNK